MSNRCVECNNLFSVRSNAKDKIKSFYCKVCRKEKYEIEKLNQKIIKFQHNNPFSKYHIDIQRQNDKPIKLIIDFTRYSNA